MRHPNATPQVDDTRERGFTLVELMVALAITTVILGATMAAMGDAVKATDSATQITTLNNGLRTGMDLMIRDLMQAGQGLPAGRVIGLPNGNGATTIRSQAPGSNYQFDGPSFCPPDPNNPSPDSECEQLSAIIPGPGMGPKLAENGLRTDMMWILAADSAFERVPLSFRQQAGRSRSIPR